jgi:hypothetical protein
MDPHTKFSAANTNKRQNALLGVSNFENPVTAVLQIFGEFTFSANETITIDLST